MNEIKEMPAEPKEDLRAARILFGALMAGAIMFSIIVVALNLMQPAVSPFREYENIVLGAVAAIALVCLFIARNQYSKGIAIAKDSLISYPDKLNQYRATLIRYMALCEGPALLGIILFFVSGNYLMLIITIVMLVAI